MKKQLKKFHLLSILLFLFFIFGCSSEASDDVDLGEGALTYDSVFLMEMEPLRDLFVLPKR